MSRPSTYDAAYCEEVIRLGELGKSVEYMAGKLGVCVNTLSNWAEAHEEFLHAFTRARQLSLMWWEDRGQDGMERPGNEFQGSIWSRNMAARFPATWREVKGTELTGKDGAPVETIQRIERVIVDPANPDAP
jgi:hypothetical protein